MISNQEAYRDFCLSLGSDVTEKMPFGKFAARYDSILVLYVEGHMFTYADMADYSRIYLKVDTEKVDELYARYTAVSAPLNMSKRHWVSVAIDGDMDEATLCGLIREAYGLVKEKYKRKCRMKN